jgi:hypothetical protein
MALGRDSLENKGFIDYLKDLILLLTWLGCRSTLKEWRCTMKTHCVRGHEMVPENVYMFRGYAQCRECRKQNRRNDYKRQAIAGGSWGRPTGPKQKRFCINGHEMTPENTSQLFKNGTKNGRDCIQCRHEEQKRYRESHPDIMRHSRITHQGRQKYGMTSYLEERVNLLATQDGACAICGRTGLRWGVGKGQFNDTWHVDHNHEKPGTHRGVLCARCNTALGRLEKLLPKVLEYLKKYGDWEDMTEQRTTDFVGG